MAFIAQNQPIILHAEPEHDGIRLTVLSALVVGLLLGYLLISQLIRLLNGGLTPDYILLVSCVGALPLAFLVVWLTEWILKRTWRSGISITLTGQGRETSRIVLQTGQGKSKVLDGQRPFNQINWFFSLKGYPRGGRERRINKNWFCLACELQQDDEQMLLYAYASPKQAAPWISNGTKASLFQQIFPPDLYDTSIRGRLGPPSRPHIPSEILRSADGRYWLAERRRWQEGLELTAADLAILMQFLEQISSKQ